MNPESESTLQPRTSQQVRVHVFVEGRVQGVWFRETTRRQAERLGVNGWVRNLPDGRVEAVYEGERQAVEELLAWTHRGPEHARVARVEIHDEDPRGEQGFRI
ncbi:MAG: acylphosphatase, partial [Thermoleophilia bacterium]|nr:acylphosphatase [Thermoleophilia bacterium]